MTQPTAIAPTELGPQGAEFAETAARAAAFYAENDRHPEPGSRNHDESLLGSWLNRQRKAFIQKRSPMSPARVAHLDEVYPAWRLPAKA
ncbi:helicase associated domain-containing protein [Cellulosimicrobium sp. Marseille-Q4280]|uniref:helicase associated domain-containing protein n=1 Tax=Cellulosimicrobium sp. Marseille-Q4280 TaxID=2937992 RepID=UPI00203E2F27|nr:helicase associated domain-containing protein [Cellulosimicrobium sp. Marseille-Q4280]